MSEPLRRKLLEWMNVGPLGTLEGRAHDIQRTIDALGEGAAPSLLDLLVALEAERDEALFDAALELAEAYAARFPAATAHAALPRLTAHGPASIVAVVGSTGLRSLVPTLIQAVDAQRAPVPVVVEWVDALGELGGPAAREALEELRGRGGQAAEVVEEIEIVLAILASRPAEDR